MRDNICMGLRSIISLLVLLLAYHAVQARGLVDLKRSSSKTPMDSVSQFQTIYPIDYETPDKSPGFTSEIQCTVRMVGDSYWAVESWLVGDEIYKVYQDVDLLGNDCTYPFYVTHVAFELMCTYPGTLWVQADIEALDPAASTENCPYPGPVLAITEDLAYGIPGEGQYLIIMPFDEPVQVTEPYFAGCYFATETYNLNPSIVTDDDPYLCVSWNDWGEGFVDLISNPYFSFPGNMVMYSLGYTGSEPPATSRLAIYSPADSTSHSATIELCAAEVEDTIAFDKCRFEYYSIGTWHLIGEDTSRDVTFRNGVVSSDIHHGYSYIWDISAMPEDWYSVRAMLYLSDQVFSADTLDVFVDNTSIKPIFINPLDNDNICDTVSIVIEIVDEDASFVQFELRVSSETIDMPLPLLDQYVYGDIDGDTLDGNPFAQGEYGAFYNGPTIVTSVLQYFVSRGYSDLMMIGTSPLTPREMVETIADSARVRMRYGSEDDNILSTLSEHLLQQGDQFRMEVSDDLDLNELIYYTAYRNGILLLGITQPFGHWLGISELSLPAEPDGSVNCRIYDTRGGLSEQSNLRFSPTLGIDYQGSIRTVDRVVAVYPKADTTAREVIGGDFNGSDGWSYFWNASSKPEGAYLLAAIAVDVVGHIGEGISWIKRQCTSTYLEGDANSSGEVDIDDIIYIVAYIFAGGPVPVPELLAGDANCSDSIDIDDIVYLVAYIFGGGPEPCGW